MDNDSYVSEDFFPSVLHVGLLIDEEASLLFFLHDKNTNTYYVTKFTE
jgi:hypothetical protein